MNLTPDIATIAAALETALQTIEGLQTAPNLIDNPTPPVAIVAVEEIEYHGAFGKGDVVHNFSVFLLVSRADLDAGLGALAMYASQPGNLNSVPDALGADPTLGGVVSSSIVRKASTPRAIQIGTSGASYLMVEFTVVVHA